MPCSTPGPVAGTGARTATLTGATRVLLVRHGVTDLTAAGRVDGRGGCDPPLNADGRRQAETVGQAVHALVHGLIGGQVGGRAHVDGGPCRVVTSSLARAAQTGDAVAAALGVGAGRDGGWDEQGFGDWDGQSVAHLHETVPNELRRLREDPDHARPGGESLAVVHKRVLAAWDRAVATSGTVVIVTSRKPILVVLAHVLGLPPRSFWTLTTDPASLTALDLWPDGNASVPFTNRTDHLR